MTRGAGAVGKLSFARSLEVRWSLAAFAQGSDLLSPPALSRELRLWQAPHFYFYWFPLSCSFLQDCRTSVIKNKNESCFIHQTSKSTGNTACKRIQGGASVTHREGYTTPCALCLTQLPNKTTFTFRAMQKQRNAPSPGPLQRTRIPTVSTLNYSTGAG